MLAGPLIAIESSCDETAVAIIDAGGRTLCDIVHSQVAAHAPYGGVVPEIASREHLARIAGLVRDALVEAKLERCDLRYVAVTFAPGLIGALLVGVMFAKGLARALGVPLVGVHHLEGHLMAAADDAAAPGPPFVGLVASGGHTALYRFDGVGHATLLGQTRDDAAGEAFDKTAKLLGLGYPGGAIVDRLADGGDAKRFAMPVSLKDRSTYDFSFSGLKTAVRMVVDKHGPLDAQATKDLCACVRTAIVTALVNKSMLACRQKQIYRLVLGGGVAANSLLRAEIVRVAANNDVTVFVPPKRLCTDNAVMIARAARAWVLRGAHSPMTLMAQSDLSIEHASGAFVVSPS